MAKGKEGYCHICGKFGKLSFEHIPPHSMGNDKPTKSYKVADIAEMNRSLSLDGRQGLRYHQQQKGIGFQTLCPSCNSYLGKHYVKPYTGCIRELGSIIASEKDDPASVGIHLEAHEINILAFFKHVVSNFCSTTQPNSLLDCKEFLLDCESNDFPSRLRLFMFAVPKADAFVSSGWVRLLLNEDGPKVATLAFIAHYPVGFYLLDADATTAEIDSRRYGCEITPMARQPWGAKPDFALDLPYMTIDGSIPVPITPVDARRPFTVAS